MRIGFIGDIIGRPGRQMLKNHLRKLREAHRLDLVVANAENASHGFGLNPKNATELHSYGVDILTGGNHTWDKKEILPLLVQKGPVLRPDNYPEEVPGRGLYVGELNGERFAILNLMGQYGMPMVENPFRHAKKVLDELKEQGIATILIDFHAEATSEKRGMLMMYRQQASALFGTHTHVGTDDLCVDRGCAYVSDVGLTGCRDNVIGMDEKTPIERFMTGLPGRFEVTDKCKKILQMIVCETVSGRTVEAYKIKAYDGEEPFVAQQALIEA